MATARSVNIEIEDLPNNVRCAQCKLVLKDAQLVPCGCTFCRVCIDNMMAKGDQFCPGDMEDCRDAPLSSAAPDYRANKSVSRLTVKCVHDGCVHECSLADMEEHLRQCPRNTVEHPIHDLAAMETSGNCRDTIGDGTNIDIEVQKRDLELKDGQIRTLMDQMIHVENENKSMQTDIKSLKRENVNLATEMQLLREIFERETERLIEYVEVEIGGARTTCKTIKNQIMDKIDFVENEISSINEDLGSIQTLVGLGRVDARLEWDIYENVEATTWNWRNQMSEEFCGTAYPYIYNLSSENHARSQGHSLAVWLRINSGRDDDELPWPFNGRVAITVTDRNVPAASISLSRLCQIDRPLNGSYLCSDQFRFDHSELQGAGINLRRGVRLTCMVDPQ